MGLIVAGLKNKVIKCEGELTNGWGILGIFNFGMVFGLVSSLHGG